MPVTKPGVPPKKSRISRPVAFQPPTGMTPTSSPIRLWRIVVVIDPLEVVPTRFGLSSQLASPELTTVFDRMVPDSVTGKRDAERDLFLRQLLDLRLQHLDRDGGGWLRLGRPAAPRCRARPSAAP